MRLILVILAVVALSAWGGYAVRKRDAVASGMLFAISALAGLGLAGAFFGWFGS
jgi:hypothetical protein